MNENTKSSKLGSYGRTGLLSGMSAKDFGQFDMFAWWKGKDDLFLILSTMAQGLLTAQASKVA